MLTQIHSEYQNELFFINITLDESVFRMFIDTGATASVLFKSDKHSYDKGIKNISTIKIMLSNNNYIKLNNINFYIKNLPYVQIPCSTGNIMCDGIIGVNVLKKISPFMIDYKSKMILITK
jgi:hypothetical protein